MFGSCFNRNDIFPKPKMFDNVPDWLDRLKSITDYQISKWDGYENTKQDKISATYPILFNNNKLSFDDNYVMDIVRPSLTAVSESCSNAISGFLSGLETRFITANDANVILNEMVDEKFEDYDKTIYLKQQWDNDINIFTYSKVDIQNFLADKQGQLDFGKGIRYENPNEISVNIERELAVKRYFDIDKHVYDDRANKDEEEEESVETVINFDEFENIIGYQAFTVKNLLKVLYDEDTKTYKLTVPYTNRLVDADYAISSRTILRELRNEYEKKIFVLGNSIQLLNIDFFIHKFREAFSEDTSIGRQDYKDPSKISDADIRTAFFRTNVDYPLLKTDFEGWFNAEYGPTAVDHLTDLVGDYYQRAIMLFPEVGALSRNADGSQYGNYYWKQDVNGNPYTSEYDNDYLYTIDTAGAAHTPDQYSLPSAFDVKKKIVETYEWIDGLKIDVDSVNNTNTFNLNLIDKLNSIQSYINFNLNYNSSNRHVQLKSSDKLLTEIQLPDFIVKSQTQGLVKNDGTIDTTTYTTQDELNSKISGVKLNGVDLTKDSNNKVNVIVPQVYSFL